jgi:hypothetical protein
MVLTATSKSAAAARSHLKGARRARGPHRGRLSASALLAAAFYLAGAAAGANADWAVVQKAATAADKQRHVTIILRAPSQIVDGDRVTLHSMLRFAGRAGGKARIEILANGVVVSETFTLQGGLWYSPRTQIVAGEYEFTARAVTPDGAVEISDVLRVTVSPPVLLDLESLVGKSVYSVGSLRPSGPALSTTPG